MRSQDFSRSQRVADQIARELGQLLIEAIDDPRVRGATVSQVEVSPDLRNAVVYVNLPADADEDSAMKGLARASGLLRRELGARIRMKYLPALRFEHDPTLDRVDRIEQLLRDAGRREP